MSDSAAHLVDEMLPKVPVRQWVCSLPWQLRYAMGYDAKLCSAVFAAFMGALRRSLRRRAKRTCGLDRPPRDLRKSRSVALTCGEARSKSSAVRRRAKGLTSVLIPWAWWSMRLRTPDTHDD
jgi:hypothetical protein